MHIIAGESASPGIRDASLMLAHYAEAQSTREGMDAHRNAAATGLRKWGGA